MKKILSLLTVLLFISPAFSQIVLRQSTAVDIGIGAFVDSTDGVTAETALTISQADVRLKKNGGAWAQKSDTNACTHEENGWYECALNSTDTDTVGVLIVNVSESGALPVWVRFQVVEEVVYDADYAASATGARDGTSAATASSILARIGTPTNLGGGSATLAGNMQDIEAQTDDIGTAGAGLTAIDLPDQTMNITGNLSGSIGSVAADGITASSIATDAIGSAEIAGDAIGAAEVANSTIDAATFAAGAIDASAVATDAIGAAEIAANAIGAAEIADGTIDEATWTTAAGSLYPLQIADQGTAQAVTATTIQLRSAAAFADDELIGATVYITSATTGAGQARTITDYVSSTDTATVATWTTTPTGTILYKVRVDPPGAGGTVSIAAGGITASSFAAGAIDASAIAADAIGSSEIATDAIGALELAANSITSSEIADDSIDAGALATDAITATEIAANAIAAAEIADGAIDPATFSSTAGSFFPLGIVDQGTAQAASSTTLQLRSAAAFTDDEIIGATCLITGGTTGVGQARTVTDYVSSTDTATVAAWTTTPSGTITYECFGTAPGASGTVSIAAGGITAASFAAGAIDASAIATDAIGAAEVAADAIGSSEVASGAIDATAIATDAITASTIATDAIGAAEIALDAIGASEIAASAIGASEIADGGITSTEFGTGAITATVIAADAIGASEIAADAIGAAEVANATIDAATFAAGAIDAAAIATDAIGAAELAADSITASEIALDAIGASEVAASAATEVQTGLATQASVDTVDTVVDAVKAKTDSLTFTVSGQVDANVESQNAAAMCGNGTTGDKWRACP